MPTSDFLEIFSS